MRPTIQDIAIAANVSAATVDRVVNNREGVKLRTRNRVLAAARRIGYLEDSAPEGPARQLRLHVLLPSGTNAFIADLTEQVNKLAATLHHANVTIDQLAVFDPKAISAGLEALVGKTDGVALVAVDHPAVREAIRKLVAADIPVVTLVSDIQSVPRLAYIGIDNGQAGRLAGYILGRFLGSTEPAKVAFFAGSLAYRGHQEREMGFRQVLTEEFAQVSLVERHEVHEDRDRAYAETLALLDRHPDLAAIYNAGGGTAGIARALKDRQRDKDIVFLAHEATHGNKALLLDGTLDAVIDQNPRVEAREALQTLIAGAMGNAYATVPPRLQIIFRENLPAE